MDGAVGFGVSVVLLSATTGLIVRHFARRGVDAFWTAVAAIPVQLGAVALATSAAGGLTPAGWLAGQSGLLVVALVSTLAGNRRGRRPQSPESGTPLAPRAASFDGRPTPAAIAACALLASFVVLSGFEQATRPISGFDDRMYHGSRVLYWIQNASVFPYVSHNDRQTISTWGSEVFFLWPVLFTKNEAVGRMVMWSAFPALLAGLVRMLRRRRLSVAACLGAALLVASAPLCFESSLGLSPEGWLSLFLLGSLASLVRAAEVPRGRPAHLFLSGLLLVLAANVRPTALAALPAPLAAVFLAGPRENLAARARALALGALLGLGLSGLGAAFAFNLARFGSPLGPEGPRHIVAADISPRQLWTHAVRLPFLLFDLHVDRMSAVGSAVYAAGSKAASVLGAKARLPGERPDGWPGTFEFPPSQAHPTFSLAGIALLPVLALGAWAAVRRRRRQWWRRPLSSRELSLAFVALAVFGPVLGARWMAQTRVPERFLVGPFVCFVAAAALSCGPALARSGPTRAAVAGFVVLSCLPAIARAPDRLRARPSEKELDEPFAETVETLTAPSRILLVAGQDARDYPLFGPRAGYPNTVVPWGKEPPDPEKVLRRFEAERCTHIVLQSDQRVGFHWDPSRSTAELAGALRRNAGFRELPSLSGREFLFEAVDPGGLARSHRAEAPCRAEMGSGWYGREGTSGDTWRWTAESGDIPVILARARRVEVRFGLFSATRPANVEVRVNGGPSSTIHIDWDGFRPTGPVALDLDAGRSVIEIRTTEPAKRFPGDPRSLAIAVRNLAIRVDGAARADCVVTP